MHSLFLLFQPFYCHLKIVFNKIFFWWNEKADLVGSVNIFKCFWKSSIAFFSSSSRGNSCVDFIPRDSSSQYKSSSSLVIATRDTTLFHLNDGTFPVKTQPNFVSNITETFSYSSLQFIQVKFLFAPHAKAYGSSL